MAAPSGLRSGAIALAAVAIGGVPVAGLLLTWLRPDLPWMAPTAIGLTGIAAIGIAALWVRDAARLSAVLRGAALDDPARLPAIAPPALPPMAVLAREAKRLAHRQAARMDVLERQLRADEAIVARLPDPLIVLAADRSVRRTNAAAHAAFGADIPAVLRHPGLRAAIDRALADRAVQGVELSFAAPVPREVQATVIAMETPLSDGGQVLVVLSDRTRERAVERMRADFVANASHELRTPLASLIGFIDTLRGPAADDPPAQIRFLGIMAEQAARMNRLIDDLLSLSRVELTEHQPPSERVDLARLLPRIVATFEPRIAARHVRLDLDLAETLPPVPGDPDQLAQVLGNLLDNALKYGPEGGRIGLSAEPVPAGSPWPARPGVVIAVRDDGPGIPRAHLPRLTERFYRVDKGRSRAVGGTGLGLAIVKHIVNRHRGQLLIESEEGAGATFRIWLPSGP
ncbi:MAG TPA: ATP-binding protein [Acetobacteraceae bacterium]|nr:ATP-binding protein [Acetobacteraceae bacterium]